jgi:integrase
MQTQEYLRPDRVDAITSGLRPYVRKAVRAMAEANPENGEILADYIFAELTERNIADSTREWKMRTLVWLSQTFSHTKSFRQMTKADILVHVNRVRKAVDIDPQQRWIGTYNNRVLVFTKFFRWLYNPDEPDYMKRTTPPCMQGVKQLPKKTKTPYKPSDLWSPAEHDVFLRYCPQKRDKCYHAMARDTSARPHELLKLRIGDIRVKVESSSGRQYAEILVSGKTKSRTIPLIDSLPYVKEWLQEHPHAGNPDAPLFIALSDRNRGIQLSPLALREQYQYQYKASYFPRLLTNPSVSLKDKETIRGMLQKPWNPYIFRHSALTEKAQFLKEATLRDHAGWTMTSKMPAIYIHFFGGESSKSILEANGIARRDARENNLLQSKACPNCGEPNTPHSKFCLKCKMALSLDAYAAVSEGGQDDTKEQIRDLRKMLSEIMTGKGGVR